MVSILLLLFCNKNNFLYIIKNSYLEEEWLFIDRFKVGCVQGIINKEVLAQFIYKPA